MTQTPYATLSKVPTSLRLHEPLRQSLVQLAERTGVSVQDHIRIALADYVTRNQPQVIADAARQASAQV